MTAAGRPTERIRVHERMSSFQVGTCRSSRSLRRSTQSESTSVIERAMTVAMAAPRRPMPSIGPQPKIMIGSRITLTNAATIMMYMGVVPSPVARMAPMPIIGTTRHTAPRYQMVMNASSSGSSSGSAPRATNA